LLEERSLRRSRSSSSAYGHELVRVIQSFVIQFHVVQLLTTFTTAPHRPRTSPTDCAPRSPSEERSSSVLPFASLTGTSARCGAHPSRVLRPAAGFIARPPPRQFPFYALCLDLGTKRSYLLTAENGQWLARCGGFSVASFSTR